MALEQQQSTARKTPFYHEHLAHGAKIVPFAGWLMPLHYGSQLKEHEAVRQDVGMFDVSHMALVDVKGPNAKLFLQYVLANDVGKIEPGRALYGCMLNQQGGIIDDLITYQLGPNHYRLIVNAATTAKDLKWLEDHNRDHEVNLEVMSDLSLLAVQGPNAKQKVAKALNMDVQTLLNLKPFRFTTTPSFTIASTGYTGEDGVEIMGSNEDCLTLFKALVEQGVTLCGLGARDTLRLEAGLNLYGQDMDETTSPFESNLGWTVDLKDDSRGFVGKKSLEKAYKEGAENQLIGLIFEGSGILRHDMRVRLDGGQTMGMITSGGFSPTLDCSIAFARIPKKAYEHVEVELRKNWRPVRVVHPPFVRQGKICVDID